MFEIGADLRDSWCVLGRRSARIKPVRRFARVTDSAHRMVSGKFRDRAAGLPERGKSSAMIARSPTRQIGKLRDRETNRFRCALVSVPPGDKGDNSDRDEI